MTAGVDATFANANLNRFRNTAAGAIATPFVKLHVGDPGAGGAFNAAAGSTTRNAAAWNAASGGSMTISTLGAWTNGGTSETLTHFSIWDASSGGTFLLSGALSSSQAWVSTNTFTLTTLTLAFTPIAA